MQTLFRIAIAILKMHESEICSCGSVGDLFTYMSNMTSRLWAADKLIAVSPSTLQATSPNLNVVQHQLRLQQHAR